MPHNSSGRYKEGGLSRGMRSAKRGTRHSAPSAAARFPKRALPNYNYAANSFSKLSSQVLGAFFCTHESPAKRSILPSAKAASESQVHRTACCGSYNHSGIQERWAATELTTSHGAPAIPAASGHKGSPPHSSVCACTHSAGTREFSDLPILDPLIS